MDTSQPSHDVQAEAGSLRNRYFRGKQMRAEEFAAEQDYLVLRRRLVSRAVLGWGVVQGLVAQPDTTGTPVRMKVTAGLALDAYGREIVVAGPQRRGVALVPTNLVLLRDGDEGLSMHALDEAGPELEAQAAATSSQSPRPLYLLRAHYAERGQGDVRMEDGCGCETVRKNFTRETVIFSLQLQRDGCACGEGAAPWPLACSEDACGAAGRGPHAALCRRLSEPEVPQLPGPLLPWRDGLCLDPHAGVALACVHLVASGNRCAPLALELAERECSPRRLVKGNDLLYELLCGRDLTRIDYISWGRWHRSKAAMAFTKFRDLFGIVDLPSDGDSPFPLPTNLCVGFSRAVRVDTVRKDCFTLRFAVSGGDTGWHDVREVCVRHVTVCPHPQPLGETADEGDGKTTARCFKLWVPRNWVQEMCRPPHVLDNAGATVEIFVHGDFILDCRGQPIDANARGLALGPYDASPGGNGTPGGSLRSAFRVRARR